MHTLINNWMLRCPACKAIKRIPAGTNVRMWQRKPDVRCECGRTMTAKPIKGYHTAQPCNARCEASKGHVCECSCGGANHGASHT